MINIFFKTQQNSALTSNKYKKMANRFYTISHRKDFVLPTSFKYHGCFNRTFLMYQG